MFVSKFFNLKKCVGIFILLPGHDVRGIVTAKIYILQVRYMFLNEVVWNQLKSQKKFLASKEKLTK